MYKNRSMKNIITIMFASGVLSVVEKQADSSSIYLQKGSEKYSIGDAKGAEEDFNKAIAFNANNIEAYFFFSYNIP